MGKKKKNLWEWSGIEGRVLYVPPFNQWRPHKIRKAGFTRQSKNQDWGEVVCGFMIANYLAAYGERWIYHQTASYDPTRTKRLWDSFCPRRLPRLDDALCGSLHGYLNFLSVKTPRESLELIPCFQSFALLQCVVSN